MQPTPDAMQERGLRSWWVTFQRGCAHAGSAHAILRSLGGPLISEYDGQQFVGIDLHRRRSVIVRSTDVGDVLETVQINNDVEALTRVLARAGEAPEVVLEATYGWYWAVDALQAGGADVHLAHPLGVKMFEYRRVTPPPSVPALPSFATVGRTLSTSVKRAGSRQLRKLQRGIHAYSCGSRLWPSPQATIRRFGALDRLCRGHRHRTMPRPYGDRQTRRLESPSALHARAGPGCLVPSQLSRRSRGGSVAPGPRSGCGTCRGRALGNARAVAFSWSGCRGVAAGSEGGEDGDFGGVLDAAVAEDPDGQ